MKTISKNFFAVSLQFFIIFGLFFATPQKTHADAVVSAVSSVVEAAGSVVSSIGDAVVSVATGVIGGIASTVGGLLGDPKLGCKWVGTNGFAELYNGNCPSGSSQATVPDNVLNMNGINTCTNGDKTTDTCFTCWDSSTAATESNCPPKPAVGVNFTKNVDAQVIQAEEVKDAGIIKRNESSGYSKNSGAIFKQKSEDVPEAQELKEPSLFERVTARIRSILKQQ